MLEEGARGTLRGGKRWPGFLSDPVEGRGGVEEPVAAIGDDGLEKGGGEVCRGVLNTRMDAVGVGVGSGEKLCEGSALGGIVDGVVVVNFQRVCEGAV